VKAAIVHLLDGVLRPPRETPNPHRAAELAFIFLKFSSSVGHPSTAGKSRNRRNAREQAEKARRFSFNPATMLRILIWPERGPVKGASRVAQIEETIYEPDLKRHWPAAAFIALMALAMFVLGAYGAHMTRAPFGDAKMRFICGGMPAMLGALILASTVGVYKSYSKLVLVMRPDNFVYNMGGKTYRRRWRDVSLTRPDINATGPFASALLSDGEGYFRLYRFVYEGFDQLLDDIDRERLAGRGSHRV
jgi:hypothetical protein